jgi:hypothetical protein
VKYACVAARVPYHSAKVSEAVLQVDANRAGVLDAPVPLLGRARREPDAALSHDEAAAILKRLGIVVPFKSIPKARRTTPHQVDRLKAMRLVTAEILDSIARCEALEHAALKD